MDSPRGSCSLCSFVCAFYETYVVYKTKDFPLFKTLLILWYNTPVSCVSQSGIAVHRNLNLRFVETLVEAKTSRSGKTFVP